MSITPIFDKIRRVIGRDATSIPDSTIIEAINEAIDDMEGQGFWFQRQQATTTLVIGQSLVPGLPSDFNFEDESAGLSVFYSNQYMPLQKVSQMEFDLRNDQSNGIPRYFVATAGSLYVYPYPDYAYPVYVRYSKGYNDLSAGGSNDFTSNAKRAVRFLATADLFMDELKDMEKYAIFKSRYEDQIRILSRATRKKRAATKIDPWGVLPTHHNP